MLMTQFMPIEWASDRSPQWKASSASSMYFTVYKAHLFKTLRFCSQTNSYTILYYLIPHHFLSRKFFMISRSILAAKDNQLLMLNAGICQLHWSFTRHVWLEFRGTFDKLSVMAKYTYSVWKFLITFFFYLRTCDVSNPIRMPCQTSSKMAISLEP